MKISDGHIMDNISDSRREHTTYMDSGEFGKIMLVTFITVKKDSGYMVEWEGTVFCSNLATKMSKKMSDVYDAYTKAVVENNYEETITPLMTTRHIAPLFILVEEYILERLFKYEVGNVLIIKASSVRFVNDETICSIVK